MQLIDSHAHLTSDTAYDQIEGILERSRAKSIEKIVNICTDATTLQRGLALVKRYPWIYNTAATTPHDVEKEGEEMFPIIAQHASKGNLIAIGETGLDYYYKHADPKIQQHFLRRYLRLALEFHLPVVIHCREAFADFFNILDEEYMINRKHAPGVLHCFTGTAAEAEGIISRGWFLSLSGIVTFKKSSELQEVAKLVPLENLLIETDTPYLAPQSQRGKLNEPTYLVEIAAAIAAIKGIPLEDVALATRKNAHSLFNFK